MKIPSRGSLLAAIALVGFPVLLSATPQGADEKKGFEFSVVKELPATPVKSQASTGTCWCFATTSFIESELLRMGSEELDLAEMFTVREAYHQKAIRFIRMNGKLNFGEGGQAHDVMNAIRECGLIPESIYPGLVCGEKSHNHGELGALLKGMLEGLLKRSGRLKGNWIEAVDAALDAYLGKIPANFQWKGHTWTPLDFMRKHLHFDPDAYIELSSYSHHRFYRPFSLEVPDNWSSDFYYNLPIDDLVRVMRTAIEKGYTIAWDGDVSEPTFSHKKGVATMPARDLAGRSARSRRRFMMQPEPEKQVTQAMRQETFDRRTTTDDHLMHMTGLVKDREGNLYFKTKNSWGPGSNAFGGYLNISEAYVRMKTIAIMVHRDALPKDIAKRLGLK